MHELGIMIHIVEKVSALAEQNKLQEIQSLVLQVGELSPVVPHFLEACYPAAVDGTLLEKTELKIEVLKASARCLQCNTIYPPVEHKTCPNCSSKELTIIGGREFLIKEIIGY